MPLSHGAATWTVALDQKRVSEDVSQTVVYAHTLRSHEAGAVAHSHGYADGAFELRAAIAPSAAQSSGAVVFGPCAVVIPDCLTAARAALLDDGSKTAVQLSLAGRF